MIKLKVLIIPSFDMLKVLNNLFWYRAHVQ